MDAKEIKASLKEAREAIKKKDFALTLKLSKSILKSDRENYMALVFLGLSLQEVGPRDQASHAFQKAIAVNSEQALAWHGLANLYEKEDSKESQQKLVKIYEKLLNIETDSTKISDLCTKLVAIAVKLQDISKSSDILHSLVKNEKHSEQNKRTAWLALAALFTQIKDLPTDLIPLFEEILSTVIKEPSSVTCDYYKEYLKLLYKLKKYTVVFDEAINMHVMYNSNIYPLEWLCKVYVETAIEENELVKNFENRIKEYYKKLLELNSEAVMGLFAEAVILYRNKDYMTARDIVKQVIRIRVGLTHAWVLLAECQLKLYCYNEAVHSGIRAGKLLQTVSKEILENKLNRILIFALSRHNEAEKWKQAISLSEKISESDDILVSIITAHINLGNIVEAKNLILKLSDTNSLDGVLLKSKLFRKQGNLKEAFSVLNENNFESCEIFVEMGMLHWELEEYEKSLVSFLKAAKLDPNYFQCFVHLGKYYEHIKDFDKARRCYQKAYKINPLCAAAGIGLSNIYRQQKNWTANLELLETVTGRDRDESGGLHIINTDVRWAWLQLGLHFLEQGDYYNSIDSLRSVIRVEPDNSHYWECLADAYMARGSYTSALKSYERAADLASDKLYPKLQVASIKLLIGQYAEAKLDFETVLSSNQCYVPALKGIAETCMNLAYVNRKEQLLGLCRDYAQYALDKLTSALRERGDLSCLWKLTGDSCALVASLPEKYSCMVVHSLLALGKEKEDFEILTKDQLFILAARCYCKAINLSPTNIMLWHDLAICYYMHAVHTEDSSQIVSNLECALATAKYCVQNNPSCWYHWNLVGIVSVHKDMKNYALAQHAFIKSVTVEPNCAMAWSNLGTLYHVLGDIKLANKSYSQAQRSDPSYINSWVGQALIAETMGHEDTMDLFRHSTQLGYNCQGAIGYASWVCETIVKAPPQAYFYSIHNMHAIPVACDALTWYTENNPNDACAWNMLGILNERLGLKQNSMKAFKKSLIFSCSKKRDKVLINYARLLTNLQQYEKAIEAYRNIKEASFNGGCGLALTLFKAEHYEESYDSYDTAMQWLAEDENTQSHALVALAAMAYMFQGPDGAKTLLFQSTQLNPPSHWGLYATLSLGLLHDDLALAQLVLKELEKYKNDQACIYHFYVLKSYTFLVQGDKTNCIRTLCKAVHSHPGHASLWLFLSTLLIHTGYKKLSKSAANFAQVSMKLGRNQMDVAKVWCIVAYASLASKDYTQALKAAQKAVHCYPDVAECWAVLVSVLNLFKPIEKQWLHKLGWLQSVLTFIKSNLITTDELANWLSSVNI